MLQIIEMIMCHIMLKNHCVKEIYIVYCLMNLQKFVLQTCRQNEETDSLKVQLMGTVMESWNILAN